ncbi:MAG: hypothetical protein K2G89_07710 [Lachnospiraceae bacterium]|nr:hypothetical protein [Lachnospiraceae bacterium]
MKMNRWGIFFLFDEQGCIDSYVLYMLRCMIKHFNKIIVVCNGFLTSEGRDALEAIDGIEVYVRPNEGYDVWAYKDAIAYIGWDKVSGLDELIMFNYTLMGPVDESSLDEMFRVMDTEDIDFWGLSAHHGAPFDVWGILPDHKLPFHLQSHFIAVRSRMLKSIEFKKYWEDRPQIKCYEEAVAFHEAIFTQHFAQCGFKWKVYCDIAAEEAVNPYPLFFKPMEMLEKYRCPFFKRKIFCYPLKHKMVDSSSCISWDFYEYIKEKTPYREDWILENLLRTAPMQDIVNSIKLDFILRDAGNTGDAKTAIVVDGNYMSKYGEMLADWAGEADIYLWGKQEDLESVLSGRKVEWLEYSPANFASVYYAAQALTDRYDCFCFLTNENQDYIDESRDNGNFHWLIENSILGAGVPSSCMAAHLKENDKCGILYPPRPVQSYFFSRPYQETENVTMEVSRLLNEIGKPASSQMVSGSIWQYTGCFWCKADVIKILVSSIPEDRWNVLYGGEKNNIAVFTSILSLLGQKAGYYTGRAYSEKLAMLRLNLDNEMIEGFNSSMHNSAMDYVELCNSVDFKYENKSCFVMCDDGSGYLPLYQKEVRIHYMDGYAGDISFHVPAKTQGVKLLFDKGSYIMFDGLRCDSDSVQIQGQFLYRDDKFSILDFSDTALILTGDFSEAADMVVRFDKLSFYHVRQGMDELIACLRYSQNRVSEALLSVNDYKNDIINRKAVIDRQKQQINQLSGQIKQLSGQMEQQMEERQYIEQERDALSQYREGVESSKTMRILRKFDRMRGKK